MTITIAPLSANHAGETVNFTFCDGHVQSLGIEIDHQIYKSLGARADGGITNKALR